MQTQEPSNVYQQIGRRLRAARTEAGMTLEEAAREINGVSGRVVLQRYEAGDRKPPIDVVLQLAQLYGKPLDYFVIDSVESGGIASVLKDAPQGQGRHDTPYARLDHIINEYADNEPRLLREITKALSDIIQTAVVAIFKFNCFKDELLKVEEHIDDQYKLRADRFEETYFPWRNQFITELAWNYKTDEHRFISDYSRKRSYQSEQVYIPSIVRHEQVLGGVLSTMYTVLKVPDQKYLIRCFNRSDLPDIVLDKPQYELLKRLCKFISERMDTRLAELRLRDQRSLREQITGYGGNLEDKLELIRLRLVKEDMRSVAIVWSSKQEGAFTGKFTFGHEMSGLPEDWLLSESCYKTITESEVARVEDLYNKVEDQEVREYLRKFKVNYGLVFPFTLGVRRNTGVPNDIPQQKGAMIFPLVRDESKAPPLTNERIHSAIPFKLNILQTYAQLAGSVIADHYRATTS